MIKISVVTTIEVDGAVVEMDYTLFNLINDSLRQDRKVHAIKLLRYVRPVLGLKQAKDIVDYICDHNVWPMITLS